MIVQLTSSVQSCDYWKQERLIVKFTIPANCEDWVELTADFVDYDTPPQNLATYTAVDGEVIIDLTDHARAYASTISYYILSVYNDNLAHYVDYQLNVTVKGLINPTSVMIPYHFGNSYCKVIPPYKMIGRTSGAIIAELYNTGAGASVTGNASIQTGNRRIAITGGFSFKAVPYGDARKYTITKQMCGVEYALLRWVSFTGVERLHIFEVVKPTTAAADNYSLMPVDNEYIEVKGRVDGFTLKMTDLQPYDLWYYSDVITSSKVEVSLDNGTTYNQVQVTTKNITLPDGDTKQNGKLEIGVNWKRYDAVAM